MTNLSPPAKTDTGSPCVNRMIIDAQNAAIAQMIDTCDKMIQQLDYESPQYWIWVDRRAALLTAHDLVI